MSRFNVTWNVCPVCIQTDGCINTASLYWSVNEFSKHTWDFYDIPQKCYKLDRSKCNIH